MYFKNFPQIYYTFDINGEPTLKTITDITANVRFRKQVLESVTLYDEYDIKEGETPEIVSDVVYNSPLYHWVIMIFNERYDYVKDWPMAYHTLQLYITDTYGSAVYDTHHWETEDGIVVNANTLGSVPISNFDYEQRVNDKKRRIKLIAPSLLSVILNQYKSIM